MEALIDQLSETRFNKIEHVSETGSTNSDLVARASTLPDGFTLIADYQTAGRGRMGRNWEAPPSANLLFSVLLHPEWPEERHQLVTPALALATVEMLQQLDMKTSIKWPNDVIVEREKSKKIAGILAEYVQQENPVLVVGMGLNIGWPKSEDSGPPESTSLTACGIDEDRWMLLGEILKNFEKRLVQITAEKEVSGFIEDYCSKSATIGYEVKVDKPDGDIIGKAVGIEKDGSLIIENENGTTSFSAGDVTHLRKP